MIFDGKDFAKRRREELKIERASFGTLTLGIVVGGGNPVTDSYVRIKEKNAHALDVELVRYMIPDGATTEDVQNLVREAAKESGIIVQLPVPEGIDANKVINTIPKEKDVDALSEQMVTRLEAGDISILPPVAAAFRSILAAEKIPVEGRKVVVVGRGRLVGAPGATLLKHLGASVTVLGSKDTVAEHTQDADIIVLGAGVANLLKPDMIKKGVVILDGGTSESSGVVVGDADPACAEKASLFTPVPGGIGPVAVIEIFGNLFKLNQASK